MKTWLVILGLILSAGAWAAEQPDCKALTWPYARKDTAENFHRLFETLPREKLVAYFFDEVAAPKKHSVARQLSAYLIGTEPNHDLRAFFELLAYSAELKEHPTPKALPLDEVCTIYHKALNVQK